MLALLLVSIPEVTVASCSDGLERSSDGTWRRWATWQASEPLYLPYV